MNRHYHERIQEKLNQLKEADRPEPIRSDGAGALDLGPRDIRRDEENPDMIGRRDYEQQNASKAGKHRRG